MRLYLRRCVPTTVLALLLPLLLSISGCTDPYEPEVINSPKSFLVVSGFINLSGVTTIRLSRTQNLAATEAPPAETGATVTIEDATGTRYGLTEQAGGTYTAPVLPLSAGQQYRLRLRTSAGREYASDLVAAKASPPIDKLTWTQDDRGVQVYVSAQDPAGTTRYYRWTYQETWEFQSAYNSFFEYVNGAIQRRQENIYQCWATANSTSIRLSSTAKLSQDVVASFPLTRVPLNSAKLHFKYSILVSQYAQTPEEYAYYELLQKNTENLGGLYDPQPSQLTGNVHCLTDAAETVIGYVGATGVTERRLFIASTELPPQGRYETGYETCSADTILLQNLSFRFNNAGYLPISGVGEGRTGTLIGYSGAPAECVDCRLRGTNVKPSFWP
ncbi:DUF4249 domain-containing protein [uncultured Hymenobacter sp.]|uniref:DUF4249 domain-containing protein n=1 Tax=uncultured Hymenobacter sp. TaxID=170016 RepID=UPI0035CAD59D